MSGFILKTANDQTIRFRYYSEAPLTSAAFTEALPFSATFFHARVSGEEIWIEKAPQLNVPQENCTAFPQPGEVAIGPIQPTRNKVAGMMGIFYGDGKLVDGSNIFAKVYDEDLLLLKALGDTIWRKGAQELHFIKMEG